MENLDFYKNKTVLITGHTGFKGSWLCEMLYLLGAKVIGYSLNPPTEPNLFNMLGIDNKIVSILGDVRDFEHLYSTFLKYKPEIVFHLAAQPIVRESYKNPRYTYDTNVMGTVNVCECIRLTGTVKSFVNITTDKVYLNNDIPNHLFEEDEPLDGYDPYSNSKSCSELVTHSYIKSFFNDQHINASTARAGNVIGGGDFASDRIIPDCVRSIIKADKLIIRNPNSTRPYQHVLEPLYCYLLIAKHQYSDLSFCSSYNIGPDSESFSNTEFLVKMISNFMPNLRYEIKSDNGPHEANFLALSNTRMKNAFNWHPKLNIKAAIKLTAEWYNAYINGDDICKTTDNQIKGYLEL